jgi:hypothetical protein
MPVLRASTFDRTTAYVRIIAVLFSLSACLSHLSFARPAKDVLVMKNGDRITCEVKSLQKGVLKVNLDYVDGSIFIDWLKVARLESSYLFIVSLQDGSIYSTKLSQEPAGDKVAIQAEGGRDTRLVDKSEVVSVTQTSENVLQRFGGSITMGATYSKGNSATQYNIGSDLIYTRTRWGAILRQNSNLAANTGAETSTRNQFDLGTRRMLSRTNYFLGAIATFLQSSVQGIDLQTSLGVGLGRYLKNTNRFRLSVLGGPGWQRTTYTPLRTDQPPQNIAVALVTSDLQAFAFKKTRLDITCSVVPALGGQKGRVFYKTNATYYIKLFGKADWNLSFYGNWDTRPPPTFSGSDYGSSTGLSWTFGNK